jgi:CheY-like chemotaxis protein
MGKKKILVVDDEAGFTAMLKRNLEATGRFDVREVNDGGHALSAAQHFRPDLAILDVMMPGTDGGEVAAQFSGDPVLASVPIIFLTAIVSRDEVPPTGATIAGRTFLAKPVKFKDLLTSMDEHLK